MIECNLGRFSTGSSVTRTNYFYIDIATSWDKGDGEIIF